MIKKLTHRKAFIFIIGMLCGIACCALPSYCINQYAWDRLNHSRDLLLQQLDHVTSTKKDMQAKQQAIYQEYQKRIDTLSDYEDHLNTSLREIEDAMK
ncbi:MAG TPA: hypothetical protein V6C81_17225 [Planktothrix sp.]|jgi:hypothetical protein